MRKLPTLLFLPIIFICFLLCLAATYNNSARLKGIVLYNRPAPLPKLLAVPRDRLACGEAIQDETLIVHKTGGLQNVVIFIANIAPESLPVLTPNLEIKTCRFQPHVQALGVDSELTIRNNDSILHDVKARWQPFISGWNQTSTLDIFDHAKETLFSFAFPQKNTIVNQKLDKPGLIRLRSDAGQYWMNGYILVMPHRYFAITDAEGKFELAALPAGRYDMVMWHETLGVKRQVVEIKAKEKNELRIKWFRDDTTTSNQADSVSGN
jgi:hypothetical protein